MSATAATEVFTAVGRRKAASARVRISRGTGTIKINGREVDDYLYSEQLNRTALLPLDVADLKGQLDIVVLVQGGGPVGQSGAIAHGLARAIQKMNPELRIPLKQAGLIKRDPRMKERKKSGQPGARKRFQFSKR